MLLELSLKDFVLIDQVSITFPKGLSVMTGETGAGKSLLVGAIKLLLGAKANSGMVRPGADQAVVQGVFEARRDTQKMMEQMGIPADEELIVRRIVSVTGRGRTYVNGAIVTLQDLKRLTGALSSIASQHDYQALLKKDFHRIWLDSFCGIETQVGDLALLYDRLKKLRKQISELKSGKDLIQAEIRELEDQARRIDQVSPVAGEDQGLEQELRVLRSAEDLRDLGSSCFQNLYAGRGSVHETLHQCAQDLERMSRLDPSLSTATEELRAAMYQAQEVSFTLRDYLGSLDSDPARLKKVEQRLYELRELIRDHGPTIEDVLAYRDEIEERLARLTAGQDDLPRLESQREDAEKELLQAAGDVSGKRVRGAVRLSKAVQIELRGLNMPQAAFEVSVKAPGHPVPEDVGPNGMDRVEFLFSPNPGQPLKPLSAIASGGELSRVMLAITVVLAGRARVETMIFDEIDAGIGGEVANRVGERLARLARSGQVIAITHFPQIASRADFHLRVSKQVSSGHTRTSVSVLDQDGRLRELTRMLGGEGDEATRYARKLLGMEG